MKYKLTNLKKLRYREQQTQKEFAATIGTTNKTLSKWESGTTYIPVEFLLLIADKFEVTTDYLLDRE